MSETAKPRESQRQRQHWLGVLSRSQPKELGAAFDAADFHPDMTLLREPQTGLVMVRGRAGATGRIFNLGELTVTRCAVQLDGGTIGLGYVQGRDKRHSLQAALLDALLQTDRQGEIMDRVVAPLERAQAERRRSKSCKAASTKVQFFTMVRGENAP